MIKAKFPYLIKKKIYERDNESCIICGGEAIDIHHVYFGTETNYGPNRNTENQGVTLCRNCHNLCHSCSKGEGVRQECIDYCEGL